MGRVLTAARVRLRPGAEPEYLSTAEALAHRLGRDGWHLWVFRRRGRPGELLEFRERREGAAADTGAEVERLDRRLRELASYRDDEILWEEVPLAPARER